MWQAPSVSCISQEILCQCRQAVGNTAVCMMRFTLKFSADKLNFFCHSQIRAILALPVLVVLDEAYIEFSSEPSRIKWVQTHDNLVVLRTFSKSAGEREHTHCHSLLICVLGLRSTLNTVCACILPSTFTHSFHLQPLLACVWGTEHSL